MTSNKFINLILRFGGMGSKFILIILLSKYLSVQDYGEFNLLTTSITIAIYVLGLDFYNYAIRDILSNTKNVYHKIVNTFLLYIVIYVIFFLLLAIFLKDIRFITDYYLYFFLISITEHLSQELYRLQIAFTKITLANTLLFFRIFGYAFTVILIFYQHHFIEISTILKIWALFNSIVLMVGLFDLFKGHKIMFSLDVNWVKKGLKVSLFFFGATFFLKILEYANRYIIAYFSSDYDVGIFSFYSNIAIIITVYISTIVTSYQLPNLIKNASSNNIKQLLYRTKKDLIKQSIICFILSGFVLIIFLYWQDKADYQQYIFLFPILGISSIIVNISLIYYFEMLIFHKEKSILLSTLKSCILNFVVAVPLIKYFGVTGAAIATIIGAVLLFYFRRFELKKHAIN